MEQLRVTDDGVVYRMATLDLMMHDGSPEPKEGTSTNSIQIDDDEDDYEDCDDSRDAISGNGGTAQHGEVSPANPESYWPPGLQPMRSQRKAAKQARLSIHDQVSAPLAPHRGPVRRSGRIAAQRARLAEAQRIKAQARTSAQNVKSQDPTSALKSKGRAGTSAQEIKSHAGTSAQSNLAVASALKAAKEARQEIARQRRARKRARRLGAGPVRSDHGYDGEYEAYKRFQEFFEDDWNYKNWTCKVRLRASFPAMTESEIGHVDFTFQDTKGRMRRFLQTQGVTNAIWHDGTVYHLEVKSHLRAKEPGARVMTGMLSSNQKKMMESMMNSPDNAFIVVHMHGLGSDTETTWHFAAGVPQPQTPESVLIAAKAVQTAL